MSTLVIISLRLTEKQLEIIDKLIEYGLFASRSEFIRHAIQRYLEELGERIDFVRKAMRSEVVL